MKKIFGILIALIGFGIGAKAQHNSFSDFIDYEKQFYLPDTIYKREFKYAKSSDSEEIVLCFYHTKHDKSDTITFYIINTKTDSVTKEIHYIEGINQQLIENYCPYFLNLILSQKYLVIISPKYIYLFDRQKLNYIEMKKKDFNFSIKDGYFIGENKLFLYEIYNNSPKDAKFKTEFYVFSVPDFTLHNEFFPDFEMIQYSHIAPNHWVSVHKNKILFSNTTSYKINLLDETLNITETIKLPPKFKWRTLTNKQKKVLEETKSGVPAISEILKHEKNIDRIWGVYFVNDSTFVTNVYKGVGNSYENFFDIWKLINGKWTIAYKDLQDKFFNSLELKNNEYSLCQCGNCRNFIITEEYIYQFFFAAPISLKNISNEEYLKQSNEYSYENNPFFQILKFKHKLNE